MGCVVIQEPVTLGQEQRAQILSAETLQQAARDFMTL